MNEPSRYTEDSLHALEPAEHDFQEFKSPGFIAENRKISPDFTGALSKQVSAFANGAGGKLFLGLNDNGQVSAGVPIDLKPGGTRAWLEDIIPGLVDPPLRAFNVFEVPPSSDQSPILPGHAVYVIDIAPSEDAPHQALDYRYYLRIAGKSRPMGNVHIQDVISRTRHPRVDIIRVGPYGKPELLEKDPRGPKAVLCFQTVLANLGRTLATHVGAELILPRAVVDTTARARLMGSPDVRLTQRPGEFFFFRYNGTPVFPGQELVFSRLWVTVHARNVDAVLSGDAQIAWRVYADDAPPKEGRIPLNRYASVRQAAAWLSKRRLSRALLKPRLKDEVDEATDPDAP